MHKKIFAPLLIFACMCLIACKNESPKNTLNEIAQALEERQAELFLSHLDMPRFAKAQVQMLTEGNEALEAFDSVGKLLGLGSLNNALQAEIDITPKLVESFTKGVNNGELVLQCAKNTDPYCPWVPKSLENAQIITLSDNAAIAKVTTPTKASSWLSMVKVNGTWKIVAQAVHDYQAVRFTHENLNQKGESSEVLNSEKTAPPPAPLTENENSPKQEPQVEAKKPALPVNPEAAAPPPAPLSEKEKSPAPEPQVEAKQPALPVNPEEPAPPPPPNASQSIPPLTDL